MTDTLITFLATLPIGAVLGWFANRLLAPTFDELGSRIKAWAMAHFSKDEYSTYVAYSNLHKLIAELHKQGHNYFSAQKQYLHDHNINLEIKSKTGGQLRNITTMWVRQSNIGSYAESDIFFAGMEVLLPHLTKENIADIYTKNHENSQANLWVFLETVEKVRPDLLTADTLQYLRERQKEWADILEKREERKKE